MSKPNRDIPWDDVKLLYDKGLSDKELAEHFHLSISTVTSHRNRNHWGKPHHPKDAHQKKKKDMTTREATVEKAGKIIEKSSLTDKQKLFCVLYLKYYNATKAYFEAYHCSYATALTSGSALLGNPRINKFMKQLRAQQSKAIFADTTDILLDYLKQMRANIGDYVDSRTVKVQRVDNQGKPMADANGEPIYDYQTEVWLKDLSNADMSVVDEIHKGKDGVVVKLINKQHAMDKLLERLPEPVSDKPTENTFMNALKESKQIFREDDDTDDNSGNGANDGEVSGDDNSDDVSGNRPEDTDVDDGHDN